MAFGVNGDEGRSPVLTRVEAPSPEMVRLADYLYEMIRAHQALPKKPKPTDDVRFRASLLAFTDAIATIALMPIPPHDGVYIAFGNGAYTGSEISAVHLREIRNSLDSLGLIVCGGWLNLASDKSKNHATRIRFTSEFRSLVEEYGLTLSGLHPPTEPVMLSEPTDTAGECPPEVEASRDILNAYNLFIRDFDLTLPPEQWRELQRRVIEADKTGKADKLHSGYDHRRIYLTRIFTENWERGGRLYGPFYQGMPKDIREKLLIDGEPTVELDYSRLHPRMLFNEEGLELDRDPYAVPGFDIPKDAAKETFNRLLNSRRKIAYRPKEDSRWFDGNDAFNAYRDAMVSHLHPIAHLFQSDHGARLQKRDSGLAINILRRCMMSGIPIYPVHDSFIVPREKEESVKLVMQEEYRIMFGFDCDVSS